MKDGMKDTECYNVSCIYKLPLLASTFILAFSKSKCFHFK